MENLAGIAIKKTYESENSFCRYITGNDTGTTGAHQAGFYMPKVTWPLFFDSPGVKGENKDKYVSIKWQDEFYTESRFIYYGKASRNEYRLTRFGQGFPLLRDENVGDLLIICHMGKEDYNAFVLSTDDDIEDYLTGVGISSADTNKLIPKLSETSPEEKISQLFVEYLEKLTTEFPQTSEVSLLARQLYNRVNAINARHVKKDPDSTILKWLTTEYDLFKQLEIFRYAPVLQQPFQSVDSLVEFANTVLNRRKSRAGKSLEHHLSEIFDVNNIKYCSQCRTEGNSRPDFIFPTIELYRSVPSGSSLIAFLAAKTTCKDRWRQIISEADKIPVKHLFTLQQGISMNQLQEMEKSKVQLVVPQPYVKSFPKEYQEKIWNLKTFVNFVKEKAS